MTDARHQELRQLLRRWSFSPEANEGEEQPVASIRRKLYLRWMAFARVLGKINTVVLLTMVYVVLLGPVALVFRLLRRDLLDRNHEERQSYWYDREHEEHSLERRSRQF